MQTEHKADTNKFLQTLCGNGNVHEVRILGTNNRGYSENWYGYFDNTDRILEVLKNFNQNGNHQFYITLNPCNPACLARCANRIKSFGRQDSGTSDHDIDCLTTLLVDCDPVRPAGISATDEELKKAEEVSLKIMNEIGKPLILGMSGNGRHLEYRHTGTTDQVKAFLLFLAEKYNTEKVKVDISVHNPARITKILGTKAKKGENTAERPHRVSTVLKINEDVLPLDLTRFSAALPEKKEKPKHYPAGAGAQHNIDLVREFLSRHSLVNTEKEHATGHMFCLETCGFDASHRGNDAAVIVQKNGLIIYQCFHNSCQGRTWVELREQYDGPKQPKTKPCNRCGKNIVWQNDQFCNPETGKKHRCSQKKKKATEQVFDVNKPTIEIKGGQLPKMVDQAEQALLADAKISIYQKNGLLVKISENLAPKKKKGDCDAGSIAIQLVDCNYLVGIFTQVANWQKYDAKSDILRSVDCPKKVAEFYFSKGSWKLPALTGIITAPTLRVDGSILEKTGYDKETGLYFYSKSAFPKIPQNPSLTDAQKALEKYKKLLKNFPFVSNADKAVSISSILTALVRPSLRTAPLHCFSAPSKRSGKTLLADIPALIATGRNSAKISFAKNPEEMEKRFFSTLLVGKQIICIDNVEIALGSAALCIIITETKWMSRLLGQSKMIEVDTCATWLATGNNLTLKGDLTGRSLLCYIDPACERPGERKFDIDLREGKYIPENRGELVQAGLTILRAIKITEDPPKLNPFGGFETWNNWIRAALIWCGAGDPYATAQEIEENDPEKEQLTEILSAWYEYEKESKTLRKLKESLAKNISDSAEIFTKILLSVAKDKNGEIDTGKLGRFLRKYNKKIVSNFQLIGKKEKNKNKWRVIWVGKKEENIAKKTLNIVKKKAILKSSEKREEVPSADKNKDTTLLFPEQAENIEDHCDHNWTTDKIDATTRPILDLTVESRDSLRPVETGPALGKAPGGRHAST